MTNTREAIWTQAMLAERRGDAAAYEAFLRDFAAALRRVVAMRLHRLGLGVDETEDVVQEVLIAVHCKRDQWDAARPLLPWLNAIARFKTIDAMRRLKRQARGRLDLSDEEWAGLFTADDAGGERQAADVEKLILELPAAQQAMVRVIGVEGASYREAAERLGANEGSIRVAFHRALKKLTAAASREGWK